jgi:iron complex outermembrane receptor protein
MTTRTRVLWATTALVTGLLGAGAASAQSTGTLANEATTVEEVVVTGVRGPRTINGAQVAEPVDKARSTITQELITRQQPGQTILQSLNLVPGLNFTNSDPYGNSGGNIRLRGFDGQRVGLAVDGVPLNDTGNYATYTNQQVDPELIERASVTQGSTDVDSPTPAAIGGLINYTTARPLQERSVQVVSSMGSFNYGRVFLRGDTGAFGPWGTTAYLTGSYTNYDKFKGSGELEKVQFNGKLYQDLGNGDFASLGFNWNVNRNAFYNNSATLAQFNAGLHPENDLACVRAVGVNGAVDNESTSSSIINYWGGTASGSCTNYTGLRINPSNTGNIRGSFSYHLLPNLRLTIDPSFQYVMANGGGFTLVQERDDRLDRNNANNSAACLVGANLNGGVDLNGDGDSCDNVGLYTPSNTNTRRYGVLSSLIWDLDDHNRVRVSYSNDYGRHRQTGEATRFNRDSTPPEVFGGQRAWGNESLRVYGTDGSYLRSRDRFSLAILNQFSVDYRGQFFNDSLTVMLGVRAPFFKRELNQFCYTQNGTGTVLCTTMPIATTLANGNVQFTGNSNQYVQPFSKTFKYDDVLPNVTIGYDFGNHNLFGSYSEQIATPRTDNLYTVSRSTTATSAVAIAYNPVQPEHTKNYELGYRYTSASVLASASVFLNQYDNRVISTIDNDPTSPTFNTSIDRNVGKVESKGFEGSVTWAVSDSFSLYATATYLDAQLQEDQVVGLYTCPAVSPVAPATGAGCTPNALSSLILPTQGKKVVETPEWQSTFRADWQVSEDLSLGLQAKWVDERFTTDVNDEKVPSYTTVDFDARYDLTNTFGIQDAFVQFNVSNMFDESYPINISSGTNALTIADVNPGPGVNSRSGSPRTFGLSAPRTMVLTVGTRF